MIYEVDISNDYSGATITIDIDAFEKYSFGKIRVMLIGSDLVDFQIFRGLALDDVDVTIQLIDDETDKAYEQLDFPQVFYDYLDES